MPAPVTVGQRLQRAYDNYSRAFIAVTEFLALGPHPSQAAVDAVVAAGEGAGLLQFQLNYSADGKGYDWIAYQNFLEEMCEKLPKAIQIANGPYEIRTRIRPY